MYIFSKFLGRLFMIFSVCARFTRYFLILSLVSGTILQATSFQEILQEIAVERANIPAYTQKTRGEKIDWSDICSNAKDAVVQIFSYTNEYPIFTPYKTPDRSGSCGTGFLISDDGYMLTNFHVIDQAVVICVQFPSLGKDNFQAELVGGCPDRDIALLRLMPHALNKVKALMGVESLPHLVLGDSDVLGHGDEVLVLGYPLGMENLKSSIGDYSGKESLSIGECIQTSAPINPG